MPDPLQSDIVIYLTTPYEVVTRVCDVKEVGDLSKHFQRFIYAKKIIFLIGVLTATESISFIFTWFMWQKRTQKRKEGK